MDTHQGAVQKMDKLSTNNTQEQTQRTQIETIAEDFWKISDTQLPRRFLAMFDRDPSQKRKWNNGSLQILHSGPSYDNEAR